MEKLKGLNYVTIKRIKYPSPMERTKISTTLSNALYMYNHDEISNIVGTHVGEIINLRTKFRILSLSWKK